ncbi:MAG: methyltransferase domain-containing protein [Rhodospirillales bacterium]|nr:methyltransferase domain-containing protein [Rhodospirillales bacterium]MDP6643069.1 methyltransferase domain-containing protein [Rhodospirillales bacterium]MDP6841033.1 methyltransferase domain-containing protein [Rhodospirillales bacterium]
MDFLGNCTDLSQFDDAGIEAIYASHVFEHLDYQAELLEALAECHRVLRAGGELMVSVPNFGVLCQLFAAEGITEIQRFRIMRPVFGGQTDEFDYHKVGLIEEFLVNYLRRAGFTNWRRVEEFSLFNDGSSLRLGEYLVSLNMIATK